MLSKYLLQFGLLTGQRFELNFKIFVNADTLLSNDHRKVNR